MMNARWLASWANERFPLRNGLFFVLLYATVLVVARASVASSSVTVSPDDLFGVLALWSFFLLLRILDEHKDFASDAVAHPDRVLQRGLVTLPQLRVVGGCALVLQLVVSLWYDEGVGAVTAWWAASLAWSALMTREFFAPVWLRRHLLVYAVSHMVVMLFLVGWVAAMADPMSLRTPTVWLMASLVFLGGLVVEVARKLRAPEDERPMADSYTRALGAKRASLLLASLAVIACAVAIVLGRVVVASTNLLWPLTAGGLSVAAALAALEFARRPTRRHAKLAESAAGLATMATHVMVIAAVMSVRTIVWR